MRKLALVVLAACGSSKSDGPRCADALTSLAKKVGATEADAATAVATCEDDKWPQAVRACVADAPTARAAAVCVKPVLSDGPAPPRLGPAPVPSKATKAAVAKVKVRAVLFAQPGPIADHVKTYLGAAGIPFELVDRLTDVERATHYRITRDGLVLVRDPETDVRQHIEIPDEPKRARAALANLDQEIGHALWKLGRETRKAYVTAGHGEQTERLSRLDQQIKDLSFVGGTLAATDLAKDVPADATIVMTLAPATAFSDDEQAALGRYLDRGGKLLVAFDPKSIASMGALDARLGVKLAPGKLADDQSFLPQRNTAADHRFVVTSMFSAHATTTSLSRRGQPMVIVEGGALETVAGTAKPQMVIRSMTTSFLDLDADDTFDDGKEKRATYDLAAAVTDSKFRAFVIADVDVFSDALVAGAAGRQQVVMLGGPLFTDVMRWLAEEELAVGAPIADGDPPPDERGPQVMRAFIDVLDSAPKHRDAALEQLEKLENKSRAKP